MSGAAVIRRRHPNPELGPEREGVVAGREDRPAEPNLDESDDEDVSKGQLQFDVVPPGEDTDSAVEDEDDDLLEEDSPRSESRASRRGSAGVGGGFLSGLPPRWRNWVVRGCSGLMLISGFSFLVYLGAAGLLFLTYLVLTSCYSEVTRLAFKVTGASRRTYRTFVWTLYFVVQYYLAGKAATSHLASSGFAPTVRDTFAFMSVNHEAVCFSLYLACLMWFVLLLDNNYIRSYALLAWCHMYYILVCVPGQLMNASTFNGLIWYVMPMTLITLNDIAAFYVGFFFGKTPLIKLSPKKTKEGFFGGGAITVLLGALAVHLMVTPYLVCPVRANDAAAFLSGSAPLFQVEDCSAALESGMYASADTKVLFGLLNLKTSPFVLTHGVTISVVCSLIGPFGGFLASGFKRGCKRKNFGGFIPGHGGVTDRCDCMFLCAAIISVYYNTFIKQ